MHPYRIALFSGVGLTASIMAACSGSNTAGLPHSQPTVAASATATAGPILVSGSTAHYTGTDVTSHVFQSPSPTQTNFSVGYSFTKVNTFAASAAGAPAAYDLNSVTTYTTTQAPTSGTAHQTETSDDYESQTGSGTSVTVALVGSTSTTVGKDVVADSNGGGPFLITTNGTTTYSTPRAIGTYPLTAGATTTANLARTIALTTTDETAGGVMPGSPYTSSSSQTYANDGSFTRTDKMTNGETDVFTETPNGTVTENETGPIYSLALTIGVPVSGSNGYTIPVNQTRQNATLGATPAPTATTASYSAADWYPGAALPPTPLTKDVSTVKGVASSLPSGCSGAITEPNTVEVDDVLTSLEIDGSYATTTTQRFDSNGTVVCILRTATTNEYAIQTGIETQVETETFAQVLTSLTLAASSSRSATLH